MNIAANTIFEVIEELRLRILFLEQENKAQNELISKLYLEKNSNIEEEWLDNLKQKVGASSK